MRKKAIILALFALLAACGVPGSEASIGINPYGSDLLLAYNEGTISPYTYLNITTGLLQHANAIERIPDVTMWYGLARNISGTWVFFGLTSYPANVTYSSNNLTYWAAWSTASVMQSAARVTFTKNHTQGLTDDYVLINLSYTSDRRITGTNYVGLSFLNVNVSTDNSADQVVLKGSAGVTEFYTNTTTNIDYKDVTFIVISDVNYSYRLNLELPHVALWRNGSLHLLRDVGLIEQSVPYNIAYQWIDAGCTITCPSNCEAWVTSNATDYYINLAQYETDRQPFCKWTSTIPGTSGGTPCTTGNCSVSTCRMYWVADWGESYVAPIGQEEVDVNVRCNQAPAFQCYIVNPARDVYFGRQLKGAKAAEQAVSCGLDTDSDPASYTYGDAYFTYNVSEVYRNVTLLTPVHNYTINSATMINFTANYSWVAIDADNSSLYLSNQSNAFWVQADELLFNHSTIVTTALNWTVVTCYAHSCFAAWNGNFSILYAVIPGIPDQLGGLMLFPPKRKDSLKQLDTEDKGILVLGGGIILMGLLFMFLRRRDDEKGDYVDNYTGEIRK